MTCTCPADASSPWDCINCPAHGDDVRAECEAEQEAEIAAENAWLHAAEAPTMDDYAFEQYESEIGLGLGEIDAGGE